MALSDLNFVDYLVLAILFSSGILATLRGFMRELLGLTGWIVAVITARLLQAPLANYLEDYITEETVVTIISWSAPFVAIVLGWFIFANIAAPGLKKVAMGNLDRPLGFLFGVFRGVVVVALIYLGVTSFSAGESRFPQPVLDSESIEWTRIVANIMTDQDFASLKRNLSNPDGNLRADEKNIQVVPLNN